MTASGLDADSARSRAAFRVFGSKPGAYGAGLQALLDERIWDSETDLAEAYLEWGAYAYGRGAAGAAEPALFRARPRSEGRRGGKEGGKKGRSRRSQEHNK